VSSTPWTLQSGHLTHSLKVDRRAVLRRYASALNHERARVNAENRRRAAITANANVSSVNGMTTPPELKRMDSGGFEFTELNVDTFDVAVPSSSPSTPSLEAAATVGTTLTGVLDTNNKTVPAIVVAAAAVTESATLPVSYVRETTMVLSAASATPSADVIIDEKKSHQGEVYVPGPTLVSRCLNLPPSNLLYH
jgi:hypothetical protein